MSVSGTEAVTSGAGDPGLPKIGLEEGNEGRKKLPVVLDYNHKHLQAYMS